MEQEFWDAFWASMGGVWNRAQLWHRLPAYTDLTSAEVDAITAGLEASAEEAPEASVSANAGADQPEVEAVDGDATVTVDATESLGEVLTYLWYLDNTFIADMANASGGNFPVSGLGEHTVTLVAIGTDYSSSFDTITVTLVEA